MTDLATIQIVALIGWLVLALSAFASFRLEWKDGIRLALIWAVIFAGMGLLFSILVE